MGVAGVLEEVEDELFDGLLEGLLAESPDGLEAPLDDSEPLEAAAGAVDEEAARESVR